MPQPPGVTIRGRKTPPAPARHSRNLQAHIVSGPGAGTEGFRNAPSGVRILRHPRKEIRASWKTRSARPDARNRPPRDPAQGTNHCPGAAATEQRASWESSTKDVASTVGASPEGPRHISAGIPEGPFSPQGYFCHICQWSAKAPQTCFSSTSPPPRHIQATLLLRPFDNSRQGNASGETRSLKKTKLSGLSGARLTILP